MPRLVIDKRERALIKLFQPDQIEVQTLDVGDILCEYDEGANWITERKTAEDLAASIKDGRWGEQKDRLLKSGCTVVYIIEGDLRKAKFTYDALVGVCVNTTLRDDVYLHRTSDISETKSVIEHLVKKFQSMVAPPKVLAGITCKRKKDSQVETIWVRQLMCVPMINESIATTIMKHFGSMTELQQALRGDLKDFPEVRISPISCLGASRIKKLAEVFACE